MSNRQKVINLFLNFFYFSDVPDEIWLHGHGPAWQQWSKCSSSIEGRTEEIHPRFPKICWNSPGSDFIRKLSLYSTSSFVLFCTKDKSYN